MRNRKTGTNRSFGEEVLAGLTADPKYLPSKYFYDAVGDGIFRKIMDMPEYYLTDCEFQIFRQQGDRIISTLLADGQTVDLIEFGAGDGTKTSLLIEALLLQQIPFRFLPIDISSNVLQILQTDLHARYPDLNIHPLNDDYFHALEKIHLQSRSLKLVLFIGSNIGNFTRDKAVSFLKKMHALLDPGDKVLIGFDLKKDPTLIRAAYNDPAGYTRAFNLNLLERINRELGGTFDTALFDHQPHYDPATGAATSHLVSLADQEVYVGSLKTSFQFSKGEKIFTEISQKYDMDMIAEMASDSGFDICGSFFDDRKYFVDSLWCRR